MRVRIVCYEELRDWILGKFALKLQEELQRLGVTADIARVPDPSADINHHIIYLDYACGHNSIDTLMVTHIDAHWKLRKLKQHLRQAAIGICMSADTVRSLVAAGIPSSQLCFVNPAHDDHISPRPKLIGISSRLYSDGRKREHLLLHVARELDPAAYRFVIMGGGWEEVISQMRALGFDVIHHPVFDQDVYREMIRSLDYYLYLGMDEGSMGFADAVAAGIPTIVTRQGFHLDAPAGLTHPFETEEELKAIFSTISNRRQEVINAVATWTWRDYAIKHLQIWEYLLSGIRPEDFSYVDGLASLLHEEPVPGIGRKCCTEFGFLKQSLQSLIKTTSNNQQQREP